MNRIVKETLSYGIIIVVALGIGWGAAQLVQRRSDEPPREAIVDTSAHFDGVDADVILYGASWCPVCKNTREFLTSNHVKFLDVDVEKTDGKRLGLYKSTGIKVVPVLVVGNKVFRGFNQAALTDELEKGGYVF